MKITATFPQISRLNSSIISTFSRKKENKRCFLHLSYSLPHSSSQLSGMRLNNLSQSATYYENTTCKRCYPPYSKTISTDCIHMQF